MSPETQIAMQRIKQELALNPSAEQAQALCREAIKLVREDRGHIAAAVEAKRPAKRKAKVDGEAILNEFLGG